MLPINLSIFVVQNCHKRGWFELYMSEANAIMRKDELNKKYECHYYVAYQATVQDAPEYLIQEAARPKYYVPDNLLRDPDMITTEDLPNG